MMSLSAADTTVINAAQVRVRLIVEGSNWMPRPVHSSQNAPDSSGVMG